MTAQGQQVHNDIEEVHNFFLGMHKLAQKYIKICNGSENAKEAYLKVNKQVWRFKMVHLDVRKYMKVSKSGWKYVMLWM